MYPEPPHLMVAVYGEQDEYKTFATVSAAVEAHGGRLTGLVRVAPRAQEFGFVSDLGEEAPTLDLGPAAARELIAGRDGDKRVVTAAYSHPEFGHLVLGYLPNDPGDRHPVAVSTAAGELGYPTEIWSADDERRARRFADRSRELLREMATETACLYGGIGIETGLATPTGVRAGRVPFPTELYVSQTLLDRDVPVAAQLAAAYRDGENREWERGRFYALWTPFVRHGGMRRTTPLSSGGRGRRLLNSFEGSWPSQGDSAPTPDSPQPAVDRTKAPQASTGNMASPFSSSRSTTRTPVQSLVVATKPFPSARAKGIRFEATKGQSHTIRPLFAYSPKSTNTGSVG
ncbi:hypothetical protein ORV05_12695 [Amycolatopsis cynarae]|uniref:Uncharacterized protein n=1 Tax=Amycolatopsis cynarae TaxID=2995223 RepID=A0ABY7BAZ7_9PSEU|nr:hypothetical protein [Amycolatopsis sp. HUAS 11-8]WAL68589.1 hypothetical protein ORV05_12695 [Amycolatopsis sp. HUAS 11-8]